MLSVKLETYEGPLDLLLHLIDKNKVNIYDIPIAVITEQYLDYVASMDKEDLDLVSDFLVMAATLLDIKAKMLLPAETDEEGEKIDPREELVARLTEYKLYKMLGIQLKDLSEEAKFTLYKDPSIPKEAAKYEEPVDLEKLLSGVTIEKLHDLFETVMKRQVDKLDPVRSGFGKIEKDSVRISEKLAFIFDYGKNHNKFPFSRLMKKDSTKTDKVVTFLACLELIRIGKLNAVQDTAFGEINFLWNENSAATITKEEMEEYD